MHSHISDVFLAVQSGSSKDKYAIGASGAINGDYGFTFRMRLHRSAAYGIEVP